MDLSKRRPGDEYVGIGTYLNNVFSGNYEYKLRNYYFKLLKSKVFLSFPNDILICPTPSFCNAFWRITCTKNNYKKKVSIYLDIDDSLGDVGEPYWEVYDFIMSSPERFKLEDTKGVVDLTVKLLCEDVKIDTIK